MPGGEDDTDDNERLKRTVILSETERRRYKDTFLIENYRAQQRQVKEFAAERTRKQAEQARQTAVADRWRVLQAMIHENKTTELPPLAERYSPLASEPTAAAAVEGSRFAHINVTTAHTYDELYTALVPTDADHNHYLSDIYRQHHDPMMVRQAVQGIIASRASLEEKLAIG